jgi:hypothetical protein
MPSRKDNFLYDAAKRALSKMRIYTNSRARLAKRVKNAKESRLRKFGTHIDRPKLSMIVLSFNHKANVPAILDRLRLTIGDEVIICEDGSIDGSERVWLKHLNRPNDFLIRSNDIHESRAYNRAIYLARGEFVCVLQDDDIPPPDRLWVQHALFLFKQ